MEPTLQEIAEHLVWYRSITPNGCWEYPTNRIYPRASFHGIRYSIHRLSARLYHRMPLLSKGLVCHKCDNTICFNPDHLYIGDYSTNKKDQFKTVCKRGHDTSPQSGNIRTNKKGHRSCKLCNKYFLDQTRLKRKLEKT